MNDQHLARFRGKRPSSVAELKDIYKVMPTDGFTLARAFQARADDIFIITFPKCGTTWMQQIVHGLRTRGSMDFDEISLVVPYMETAPILGIDLDAPQNGKPRVFKSHMTRDEVPSGGRYIHIIREPGDTMVSLYHFLDGVNFDKNSISMDTYVREVGMFDQPMCRDYWAHLRSWWPHRERADTLVFCFEDMKQDLAGTVQRVAGFMGIDDGETIDVATRQASFAFMKAHARQFDEHPLRQVIEMMFGQPCEDPAGKVRTGRIGDALDELSSATRAALDERWQREIHDMLGIASYGELRARIGELNERAAR